ncbi:MAG: S9 family peptidase [Acidobacteriaceae bacterium]
MTMKMRWGFLVLVLPVMAWASGPQDRTATNPKSIVSQQNAKAAPVSVEDLYYTNRIGTAAWSPDGGEIAYISNASGRLNLWVMKADGSGAQQIVKSNDHNDEPLWTPDGKSILYVQDNGGDEMYDIYMVSSNGGTPEDLTKTAEVRETGAQFSPDGTMLAFQSKEKTAPSTNLALMDWKTKQSRLLTHEAEKEQSWSLAAWSPDGQYVYAIRGDIGFDNSDVYRVNVKSGVAEDLTAHSGKVLNIASSVSPDGKTLLMSSNEKGGYPNVALLDIASKKKTWITDTQWEAQPGYFSPAGDFEYSMNADGRRSIVLVDAKKKQDHNAKVDLPQGINFESGNPSPFSRGRLLVAHQDSTRPSDLWVVDVANGSAAQLTHSARPSLTNVPLPASQIVHYKSFDGKMISAYLWAPFNLKRDGGNPAVLYPHGGPTGQTTDAFNSVALALASRGYVVIAPNVRGSTGYGLEFQKANYQDLGGGDLKDEVYAVHFLEDTGYVNAKKVGITGGSYGGYMTLMAIGKTPNIWSAAAEEYGIIDWYTMLQHSDASLQEYEKTLLGDPAKDRAAYEEASPIKYLKNEKAPLLVLQGERDIRVPKEEAEQVVKILKANGKTVEAKYYPEEGHGFMKREDQIDALNRIVAWFDKYLK